MAEAVGEFGIGHPDSLGVPADSEQWVTVRGNRAVVVPVGEEGTSEVVVTWKAGRCAYTIWIAPGHTLDDVIAYAARF